MRVLILSGAGRAFCAGYDLDWGTKAEDASQKAMSGQWDPVRDYLGMSRNVRAYMSLWESPKPVIAQVHGWCVGGGTDLALCSDLIFMAEDAQIGYPPARVWGEPTTMMWVYRLGLEHAKRLMLTGESLTGVEAERLGLASKAVPVDRLADAAEAMARKLATIPLNQLVMSKLLVNQAYENMGLRTTQMLGTVFDGIARHTPEGIAWRDMAMRDGFREAVRRRDAPFGDYGERKRDRAAIRSESASISRRSQTGGKGEMSMNSTDDAASALSVRTRPLSKESLSVWLRQARVTDPITRGFFREAGIGPGMRVLDVRMRRGRYHASRCRDGGRCGRSCRGRPGDQLRLQWQEHVLKLARSAMCHFCEGDAADNGVRAPVRRGRRGATCCMFQRRSGGDAHGSLLFTTGGRHARRENALHHRGRRGHSISAPEVHGTAQRLVWGGAEMSLKTDTIVIGAGAAGLAAASRDSAMPVSVVIVLRRAIVWAAGRTPRTTSRRIPSNSARSSSTARTFARGTFVKRIRSCTRSIKCRCSTCADTSMDRLLRSTTSSCGRPMIARWLLDAPSGATEWLAAGRGDVSLARGGACSQRDEQGVSADRGRVAHMVAFLRAVSRRGSRSARRRRLAGTDVRRTMACA